MDCQHCCGVNQLLDNKTTSFPWRVLINLSFFFIIINSLTVQGQSYTGGNKNFIELNNGEKIEVKRIEFRPIKRVFLADGIEYKPRQIKFYQNNNSFYANAKNALLFGQSTFVRRVDSGRINLYSYKIPRNFMGTFSVDFYNKDDGDLKRTRIRFLKEDLKDNEKSLKYLRQTRQLDFLYYGLALTGTSLVILGIFDSWGGDTSPLVYVGFGMLVPSLPIMFLRSNKKRKALNIYNYTL